MDDMDWIKKVLVSIPKNHKPKEGSIMICIPGFTKEWDMLTHNMASDDPNYGGGGYKESKIITVGRVVGGNRTVVWPNDGGFGIFVDALNYY